MRPVEAGLGQEQPDDRAEDLKGQEEKVEDRGQNSQLRPLELLPEAEEPEEGGDGGGRVGRHGRRHGVHLGEGAEEEEAQAC